MTLLPARVRRGGVAWREVSGPLRAEQIRKAVDGKARGRQKFMELGVGRALCSAASTDGENGWVGSGSYHIGARCGCGRPKEERVLLYSVDA